MQPDALATLVVTTIKSALAPVRADVARLEGELAARDAALATLTETLGGVRERLAGLEARAPVPGPPGAAGRDGRDGVNGEDGRGFDELAASFDGDRTLALTFTRGAAVKTFPIVLPIPRYQGIFTAGVTYGAGDVVTWGGSAFICKHATTSKPGESGAAWQLMVKAGRDLRAPDRGRGAA